jgi:hypothetical protein
MHDGVTVHACDHGPCMLLCVDMHLEFFKRGSAQPGCILGGLRFRSKYPDIAVPPYDF